MAEKVNVVTKESIVKKIISVQGRNDWFSVISDIFEMCAIAMSNSCLLYTSPSPRD